MMRVTARSPWLFVGALALAVAVGACGSPAAPKAIDVAGNWSGTWQFVTAGATVTDTVVMTLGQSNFNVTGTWTAQGGASGQLGFAVDAAMTGSMTVTHVLLTGQTCSASTVLSGTASATRIEFSVADIPPGGLCTWATSNHFVVTKP